MRVQLFTMVARSEDDLSIPMQPVVGILPWLQEQGLQLQVQEEDAVENVLDLMNGVMNQKMAQALEPEFLHLRQH